MRKKKFKADPFSEREAQKYEFPVASREFILEKLEERGKPISHQQLCKQFGLLSEIEQEALRRRLSAMVRDGQLLQNRRGSYGLINKMELIRGVVIGHKDGFGFVIPDDGSDDLFLNARQMRGVFHNDSVLARVEGIDQRGRREGFIVEVLERNTQDLVGRFIKESSAAFVEPANQRMSQEILIPTDMENNAKNGQMVFVTITEQPTPTRRPIGKVVRVLGEQMAPGMEMDVAILNHQLPHEWSEEVLAELKHFSETVPEADKKNRIDFRDKAFVTIDGEDAKDFDDAVFCEKHKQGWALYVAIADVGHYVKLNTRLNEEALKRGNSVYFPERVIPMLPEALSNELCSLKPEVDRLVLVCGMLISTQGKLIRYRFYEGVIRSRARLTYDQVYDIVVKKDKELKKRYQSSVHHLKNLFALYKILHEARRKRGAIDFELPEPKIIFGEGRKIDRIVSLKRNDAHKMIEEYMLCANISAALFILKHECAALFRNHGGPALEKLIDLRKFLNEMGLHLGGGDTPKPKDFAELLTHVSKRRDAKLIQTVLLRSLSQAIYSPENKGHFGLAFEAYTHFTSPIRRFPDLIVHRAIRNILHKEYQPGVVDPQLIRYGEHCSMTERRADEAVREAVDWLKCEYMLDKLGEEYKGIITSVTSFGFFVELEEIYIEGLVHISMLKNDYYQFDPIKHALLGERSGKQFRIGDGVKVKVVRVDLDQRQMDFMLTGVESAPQKRTQQPRKKRYTKKKS